MVNPQDYCDINEAAEILHLSVSRLYHIKNKLPHIKGGVSRQSRILFIRNELIEAYKNI